MRLRNILKICLVFWKSEPQYAYTRYAYKRKTCMLAQTNSHDEFSLYKEFSDYSTIIHSLALNVEKVPSLSHIYIL